MGRRQCACSQKYVACTMTSLTILLLYTTRHALSVTVPHIIYVELQQYNHTEGEICPDAMHYLEPIENVHEVYLEWSANERYYIFGCFYIGYILLHIPSGMFCDIYGAKHALLFGLLGSGFVTAAMPFVLCDTPWYCVAFLQVLLGSLQGISMPAILSLLQHWIPIEKQTFLTSLGYSGGCLGNVISSIVASYFILKVSWEITFYFWGGAVVVFYFVGLFVIYSHPATHPRVTHEEKQMLEDEFGQAMPRKIPWRYIFSDTATWALLIGQVGHVWLIFTVDTHLPQYFKRVIGFDLKSNFYTISIPYMCQWLSTIASGYLGDYLIEKKHIPVVYMRGIFSGVGNVLSCLFCLLSTYMQCNKSLILACFTAAMISKGCIFAGLKTNVFDITRHYSGVMQGIQNGLPAFAGLASSQIIRQLCERHTMKEWRRVFWFALAICFFTTTFYAIWNKGERATWDVVTEENSRKSRKKTLF